MTATSDVRIAAADLRAFVAALFEAKGMSQADAATVAEVLVWANLRGVESHGVTRAPRYLGYIDRGQLDPCGAPEVVRETPAGFLLRAHRAAGPIAMTLAIDEAARRAKESGVALGIIGETTHTGAIGCYAARAAGRGLVALVMAAGPPNMAYFGARVPSLSTSPLAIAIPKPDGTPLLLDMASAVVSLGKVREALDAGQPIPEGWALTEDGRDTTDPAQAAIQLPLGGPKGSGLALMIECLTSLLAGVPILTAMLPPEGRARHVQNGLVLAIDIAAFTEPAAYGQEVARLVSILKGVPRADGVAEIFMPGERGARTAAERARTGIPIGAKTWERLSAAARTLGVAAPAP
ncbi:MAG: Ldh family oxidoreductase [Alphaproteobacteria bacterium]|nr:Ldh family oxidoreductase [Alphaproteobacteria bacterium]